MKSSANKNRQLWLPFLILVALIFTASWIFGGDEVVFSFFGVDQEPVILVPGTPTTAPTGTATAGIDPTQNTVSPTPADSDNPSPTPSSLPTDPAAEFTPDLGTNQNCTFTIHFWRAYPGAWETDRIIFGERAYTQVQALAILNIEDPGLATTRLMQQYITALLNTLKGADPTEIESTLETALEWLIVHPPEIGLSQSESLEGESLAEALEDFNNGVTGPGPCLNEPFTPTPGATPTPLNYTPPATATNTPAPFIPSSTETSAPTKKPGGGGSKPTDPPTSPPPTDPPPPPPTDAPPPPTPKPTLPPPTPAPTQSPPTEAPPPPAP